MSVQVVMPQAGESITEGEIANWLKNDGDYVEEDEILAEVETEKASLEVRAPKAGVLKVSAKIGDTIQVGSAIATVEEGQKPAQKETVSKDISKTDQPTNSNPAKKEPTVSQPSTVPPPTTQSPSPSGGNLAASSALKPHRPDILSKESIDNFLKNHRRSNDDSQNKSEKTRNQNSQKEISTIDQPTTQVALERTTSEKRMSVLRRALAKRLTEAKQTAALLTTFNEVDMSAAKNLRKKYKEEFKEKKSVSLGFMSLFTKAICQAVEKFPVLNSRIEGDMIVEQNFCDVGIAVSTPKGLVVPPVRNANLLSLAEIEKNILYLALKGREGKLSVDEMSGGTITITNGGIFGSMLSTPIVNFPQSAILGLHNIVDRPVAINNQVEIRPIMYVALTYDHRLIDGAQAVQFLYAIKESIENPERMLLNI